jgi:hypothetical protein
MCYDIIKERPIATFDVRNLSNSMHKQFTPLKSTFVITLNNNGIILLKKRRT